MVDKSKGYSKNSYGRILEQAFLKHADRVGVSVELLVKLSENDPYIFARAVKDFNWDDASQEFYDEYKRGLGAVYKKRFSDEAVRLGLLETRKLDNLFEQHFIKKEGSLLVSNVTNDTRQTLKKMTEEGIQEGLGAIKVGNRIKTAVNLLPAHQLAVDKLRARLIAQELSPAIIERRVKQYHKKLLNYRARNIARTETINARNQADLDTWQAGIDEGEIEPSAKKYWITAPDERRCPICASLHGQTIFIHQSFTDLNGTRYKRPAAHPSCRCAMGIKEL